MAIRTILNEKEPLLRKKSKPVEKFDERLWELLDDMYETMSSVNGVGIAAPQVGVLRQVVMVDIGEGRVELINPKILYTSKKEEEGEEGCLSSPMEFGIVSRPSKVIVSAQDRNGTLRDVTGEGFLARAICHEVDHLNGVLFKDLALYMLDPKKQ